MIQFPLKVARHPLSAPKRYNLPIKFLFLAYTVFFQETDFQWVPRPSWSSLVMKLDFHSKNIDLV